MKKKKFEEFKPHAYLKIADENPKFVEYIEVQILGAHPCDCFDCSEIEDRGARRVYLVSDKDGELSQVHATELFIMDYLQGL